MRFKQFIRICLLMLAVSFGVLAGGAQAQSGLAVSADQMIFSAVANGFNSPSRSVTISNPTGTPVTVTTLSVTGTAAANFVFTAGNSVPFTLNPGQTRSVSLAFVATVDGVYGANLTINGTNRVALRGLGTRGSGGTNEPSLQRILDTHRIPINVGDDEPHSTMIHSLNHTAGGLAFGGAEIPVLGFVAAGGQPTFQVLGVYGNNASPVVAVGWYPLGSPDSVNQVFTVNSGSSQTLNPVTSGSLSFNPSGQFGLYSQWTYFSNRRVYSEGALNTWDPNPETRHKMRFYPLRNSSGGIVQNAYVATVDEYTGGFGYSFDYNDIVYILRNVQAITPSTGGIGGQVRVENPMWRSLLAQNIAQLNYLNRFQTIQHIRDASPNQGGLALYQHNRGVVRLYNDSGSQTLRVTGFTFSDPARFSIVGDTASAGSPINIYPNSYRDFQVRFTGSGDVDAVFAGTLTINTTATNEPNITIELRGAYMPRDEGGNETTAPQMSQALGFTTNLGFPLSANYTARGDEVLSANWRRADSNKPIYVRQLAALHGCCDTTAYFSINGQQLVHDIYFGQSLFPLIRNQGGPAEAFYNIDSDFQVIIENYNSNRGANGQTHAVRFWPVRDPNGSVVPNTYFVIQDYVQAACGTGTQNCDFNDNMYLVANLAPAVNRPDLTVSLTAGQSPLQIGNSTDLVARVFNIGGTGAENARVVVTLPTGLLINSQRTSSGSCSRSGQQVTCTFGTLGDGQTRTVTISVTPEAAGTLNTTAAVSTTSTEHSTHNNSASVAITATTPTLTQIAPLGTITNGYGDPTFTWSKFNPAQYYYLYVANSAGQQVINEVLSSAERCTGSTCSITPTTLRESYRLVNDTYTWQVKGWANDQIVVESPVGSFTLNAEPPAMVTIDPTTDTDMLRPTFNWTLATASQKNATSFNIVVTPANSSTQVLNQTLTRSAACGSSTGGDCALEAPANLTPGAYFLYIRSTGPGGSVAENGGYAGPAEFTISVNVAVLPTDLAIDFNDGIPTISWDDDRNTDSYTVVLARDGWATVLLNQVYPRTTGADGLCNNGTCQVTPRLALTNGTFNLAIRATNENGHSVGGSSGYALLLNQVLALPAPAAPSTGLLPEPSDTITEGRPTFEWDTVPGATYYRLWVGKGQPVSQVYSNWFWATAPDCQPHPGQCRVTPALSLGVGAHTYYLQAYGPGGLGAWSAPYSFTIQNTRPGEVTLLSPLGDVNDTTPTFTWEDIPNVEWYEIWIGTAARATRHNQWYQVTRGDDGLCDDGECSLTVPGLTLTNGAYAWVVRAATAAGTGPWQATLAAFNVTTPLPTPTPTPAAPAVPVLVSPGNNGIVFNTNRPTLVWNKVQNATQYEAAVANAASQLVFTGAAAIVPAATCGATTCSVQVTSPLAYGTYTWTVRATGVGGTSEWAAVFSFLSLSVNTQPMVANDASTGMQSGGSWTAVNTGTLSLGSDVLVSSGSSGDTLALAFTGTGLDVIYVAGPQFGAFIIEVDGVAVQVVNAYADNWLYGQVASVTGLADGQHVLRLLPVEGAQVAIDAIAVGGQVLVGVIAPTPATPEPTPLPTEPAPTPATPEPVTPEPTPLPTEPAPTPAPETTPEAPAPETTPEAGIGG